MVDEQAATVRKNPIYLLTIGYILALVIIGIMTFCIHVVIGQLITEQNNASVVISARQAQLSQKIAFYATQYMQYRDPAFYERLEDSVQLMRRSHKSLVEGDELLYLPETMSPKIQRIYFAGPYYLDEKVKNFLFHADKLLTQKVDELHTDDKNFQKLIETARGPLLTALEAATTAYEAEIEARIGKLQSYQKMALVVIFATLIAEAVLIFKPLVTRVNRYADRLKQLALTDGLTGVDNSRCFMQKAMKELKRARRHGKPLCVAILDIDHFKRVNDCYGHLAGDEVLKAFAQFVQRSMRLEDEFARIGGEEFVLLLPHTPLDGALLVADRIRHVVEISPISAQDQELSITVSIGVAEVDPAAASLEPALHAADQALYEAKEAGRNKVRASEEFRSEENVVRLNETRQG